MPEKHKRKRRIARRRRSEKISSVSFIDYFNQFKIVPKQPEQIQTQSIQNEKQKIIDSLTEGILNFNGYLIKNRDSGASTIFDLGRNLPHKNLSDSGTIIMGLGVLKAIFASTRR